MTATQSQIRDALHAFTILKTTIDRWTVVDYDLQLNAIELVLQSALDTQKPAGDAAEALAIIDNALIMEQEFDATVVFEFDELRTIRAALTGDCGGGDVSELKALIKEVLDNAPGDDAEQFMLLPHALAEYGWFKRAKEALTGDNAKRGE